MLRNAAILLVVVAATLGATDKLYLKDGSYQLAREYQVLQDRVRFYSTERGEWEEIPLELVDLDRTKKEASERDAAVKEDAKIQTEEDAAERAERQEIDRIPVDPGVYYIHGEKLEPIKLAESKMVTNKKRTALKILTPLPVVAGKSSVELDGASAQLRVAENRPEFYFRLSADESFRLIKLEAKKNVRIVENVQKLPVTDEIIEEQHEVETFKKQVGELVFKIWPVKDLDPGEYALVQCTDGKVNPQVWDFGVGAAH